MKVLVLFMLTLLSLECLSQSKYPSKAIIKGDTVAILSIPQVRKVNSKLVDLSRLYEENTELTRQIELYRMSNMSLNSQIEIYDKDSKNLMKQVDNYRELYILSDNKYMKERRKVFIISGVGITIGIAGVLIAIFK